MAEQVDLAAAEFMDTLRASTTQEWITGTPQQLSTRMAILRVVEALVKRAVRDVNDALVWTLESEKQYVLGFGTLMKTPRESTRWRTPDAGQAMRLDVGSAVVQSIAMDIGSGEIDREKQNIARETVNRLYDIIPAFSTVKAAGRRYGIDITDYRESTISYTMELVPDEGEVA